ncbi:hypothetical protein CMV_029831 [Castanea mollissima]|uniref:O-fucosyltransferase family protein n=1 Tax=Castanea mollissima TaxID=60419 RepID=A0A8J4QA21_9ROSI|nr:hypothetical protein CMV_029831 [Castanea mollissima]
MGGIKVEKIKSWIVGGSLFDQFNLCVVGATTLLLLCTCTVQLRALGKTMTPRFLIFWNSQHIDTTPQRVYENNGYLTISANGGLNQMRAGICDMVAIAKYLNVTLVVPELDSTSLWHDSSQFQDLFDVNYFITSLRDEVPILKQLPEEQKRRVKNGSIYTMEPHSWSNLGYYYYQILPKIKEHEVVHFNKTDFRLVNNGIPIEFQKLRCQVNYEALKFTPTIAEVGKKIVKLLRQKGPFLVLHLRYEMDMVAFSGCNEGCNETEVDELTKLRYGTPWWGQKVINSGLKRKVGGCPLTPEETALALQALDIDPSIQIYIAAGNIYGGERRMAALRAAFPNLVRKETLLAPSELKPFRKHSNMKAALDYIVAIESDIFVPTYGGNMAKLVQGHRRYLGYKITISLDAQLLVNVIDQYKKGGLNWEEVSQEVKTGHADRMGSPTQRMEIPENPMHEGYFYSNPQECLPPVGKISKST